MHLLNVNGNKTHVLILASSRYLNAITENVVRVGDVSISSTQFRRNIGAMFDQTLKMK